MSALLDILKTYQYGAIKTTVLGALLALSGVSASPLLQLLGMIDSIAGDFVCSTLFVCSIFGCTLMQYIYLRRLVMCTYVRNYFLYLLLCLGSVGSCLEEERFSLLRELVEFVGEDASGGEGGQVFASFLPGIAIGLCKLVTVDTKSGQVNILLDYFNLSVPSSIPS